MRTITPAIFLAASILAGSAVPSRSADMSRASRPVRSKESRDASAPK
jgi:hypothetical protein